MGANRELYYGVYMRVYMPPKEVKKKIKTCLDKECMRHMQYVSTPFCPLCGGKIDEFEYIKPSFENLHELLSEDLDDEDLFQVVYPDDKDFVIALPNNFKTQGGFLFTYDTSTEIVDLGSDLTPLLYDFLKEDWVRLVKVLDMKRIKFEKKIGVLQWFK